MNSRDAAVILAFHCSTVIAIERSKRTLNDIIKDDLPPRALELYRQWYADIRDMLNRITEELMEGEE